MLRSWHPGDGVIFHGTEGWISDAEGFQASNTALWKQKFKPTDEQLPLSPEHNRNFIDCVKSRQETICPVEMAIRCDAICQLVDRRGPDRPANPLGPAARADRQRPRGRRRCSSARSARSGRCGEPCTTSDSRGVAFLQHSARPWPGPPWPMRCPCGRRRRSRCRRESDLAHANVHLDRAVQFLVRGKGV